MLGLNLKRRKKTSVLMDLEFEMPVALPPDYDDGPFAAPQSAIAIDFPSAAFVDLPKVDLPESSPPKANGLVKRVIRLLAG